MFYFLKEAIASFASSWIRPWIYGDNAIIIKVNNIFLPLCLWEQGISGNYSKCINKFLFQIYVNEYALMNQIVRQRKLLKGQLLKKTTYFNKSMFYRCNNVFDLTKAHLQINQLQTTLQVFFSYSIFNVNSLITKSKNLYTTKNQQKT